MKQRCHLGMIWLTWIGLPLLAVVVWLRVGVVPAVAALGVGIVGQVLYLRWFPGMSQWLGYGSVADSPANAAAFPARPPRVTFYTANVCPFCPIVKQRLAALQQQYRFEVDEVDVTFRPEIIRAKKLRSVPVLEANGRVLVGNATSAQIADFLRSASDEQAR
jgi:glutaredoxin